jgi:hypothetical protein
MSPDASDPSNTGIGDYTSGQYNIENQGDSLNYTSFRPGALTDVFSSAAPGDLGGTGSDEVYMLLLPGTLAAPYATTFSNDYDVAGSGVRFYPKRAGLALVRSSLNISTVYADDVVSASGGDYTDLTTTIGVELRNELGTVLALREVQFYLTSSSFGSSGLQIGVDWTGSVTGKSPTDHPGAKEFYMRINFETSATLGTAVTTFTGLTLVGSGAKTTVTMVYA